MDQKDDSKPVNLKPRGSSLNVGNVSVDASEATGDDPEYQKLENSKNKTAPVKPCCCGRLTYLQFLLALVAITGLIILIIWIFTPFIAGSVGSNAELQFTSIQFSNPDSQRRTLEVDTSAVFTNTENANVDVHATQLNLMFEGRKVGEFDTPDFHVDKEASVNLTFHSQFKVTNVNNFADFTSAIIESNSTDFSLQGGLPVSINNIRLPYGIRANFDVNVTGFEGLMEATVMSVDISENTNGDENAPPVLSVNVSITNPSVVSILQMGDVSLTLSNELGDFADCVARNLSLQNGVNEVIFEGDLILSDAADLFLSSRWLGAMFTFEVTAEGSSEELFDQAAQGLAFSFTEAENRFLFSLDFISLVDEDGFDDSITLFNQFRSMQPIDVPFLANVLNPFTAEIDLLDFTFDVFDVLPTMEVHIGTVTMNETDDKIPLQPFNLDLYEDILGTADFAEIVTPVFAAMHVVPNDAATSTVQGNILNTLFTGSIPLQLSMNGTATIGIGDQFKSTFEVSQTFFSCTEETEDACDGLLGLSHCFLVLASIDAGHSIDALGADRIAEFNCGRR